MFQPHPTHFLPPRGHRARGLALAFLVLAPLACALLALSLGQDANWDLRNYHFYNAYAFINNRYDRDILPSQTPYFYNPLMDVPFYWLAIHVHARAVGLFLGFVQGFNIVLLFMIAHAALIIPNPRHKVIICASLAALGILGGGGIALIGTTFGDNVTSLGILLSAALIVRHLERLVLAPAQEAFLCSALFGLPAGMMMGLKLPAVIYCIGLCGALLTIKAPLLRRLVLSFGFGIGILCGVTLTFGHWLVFLQSHFGSPLFPYFNNLFHAPLAPDSSARDLQYVPRNLHDALLMPFIMTNSPFRVGEIPFRDVRIAILYIFLPLSVALRLFFGRNRKPTDALAVPSITRYLLTAFSLSYGVWLVMFTIYRYAVTLELIAPLLIVFCVGMLPLKIGTRALVAAFTLGVVAISTHPGNWGRRAEWLDHFVEARIPPLGDTSHLMILMAGFEPYSHLVPEFPPDIPFVRIQSNFSSPDQNKGINTLLHARVDAHRTSGGRFMLFIPSWQLPLGKEALGFFKLRFDPATCQQVTDRLDGDKTLSLCPITPVK